MTKRDILLTVGIAAAIGLTGPHNLRDAGKLVIQAGISVINIGVAIYHLAPGHWHGGSEGYDAGEDEEMNSEAQVAAVKSGTAPVTYETEI